MLQFGLFDEFKGARTLLLWGDDLGIVALGELFRQLSQDKHDVVALNDMAWASAVGGLRLVLNCSNSRPGEVLASRDSGENVVVAWSATPQEFSRYADQVTALTSAGAPSAGHQYLEVGGAPPFEIVLSRGEYPDNLV